MFIFDRCCRSSAAVTPVKYECDANNLTGTFARSKILLTEKLTNGALVTPTPGFVVLKCRLIFTHVLQDCVTGTQRQLQDGLRSSEELPS